MVRVVGIEPTLLSEPDFEGSRVFPPPACNRPAVTSKNASFVDVATPMPHLTAAAVTWQRAQPRRCGVACIHFPDTHLKALLRKKIAQH